MVAEINVVEEFKNSSSIHGLSRFGGPELYSRRRLIWITLVLSSAAALFTFVILEFIHLSEHPTTTLFTKVLRDEIDFPAVTVCNLNQVKNTVVKCPTDKDEDEISEVFYTLSELSIIVQQMSAHTKTDSIPGSLLHSCAVNHSHQLDDMLTYCHFKQKLVACSDIFSPKITEYGLCYTFNADATKRVEAVGESAGLRLFVNIEQEKYFFAPTIRAGIKVVLHDPAEEPLPSLRGFLVGPGLSASCAITKSQVTTLPSPYGSCRDANAKLTTAGTYSELTCYKSCYDDYIKEKCGCRHFFSSGSADFCDSKTIIDCYAARLKNLSSAQDFLRNCSCPPNCVTIKYDPSLSYGAFSSGYIANYLYNKGILPTLNFTDRNFIDLRLFYNSLIEEDTTEVPEKSVGSILGTLGGQMGMFIGASILSVVEIIEFIFILMTTTGHNIAATRREKLHSSNTQLDVKEKTSEF